MFKLKKKNLIILGFLFIAFMLIGMNKVEAASVTVTTYDELKEAVNGHNDGITDTSITEVKLGADIAIPASSSMIISVINNFTLDLNGYTLDITNDNSDMQIVYGSNGIENFTSGSLTITDTSASQTGTINLGIKPIFVYQYNTSNTGMHYKLTIDGGKFYGTSGTYNHFFEFDTSNGYYWKDKLITFDFKITKGYFEHVSTNMSSIILASDMKSNNVTFNMSFDNLTFKSGNNRLIASNESYSIDDVVPEDTNFYIFNSSEDKQVLIADRSTSAITEVPSSLWYDVDGYTDFNYAGIKLFKKDGFDVTAPTFDSVQYGYTSVSAKGISIYNRGTSDLQVKSVTVDEPSKFTVIGTTQPTIASKATDNTSFTIKPVDGLDAGTYTATITVTDMSDKAYTSTVTLNVGAKNLPDIGIDIESNISYGEDYAPTIIGATELGVGDYEFKYAKKVGENYLDVDVKPTSIGSYKVTVNVTNSNYSASGVSVFYKIVAKTITPTVDTISDQTYTGSEIKPTVVVKDGATTLIEGTDYEVTYSNNINVGTATATISEVTNGNYTFSDKDVNFTIIKKQLEKVTLRTYEFEYSGLRRFPEMDDYNNYNSSLQELSGTLDAVNVGDYITTVALKDSANYEWVDGTTGNLTLNWKIIQATITDASVTLPQATYRVTGSEITPNPTVVVNGRILTKYTDYTVSYTDNTNIGTATVTVTGKNNYKGTGVTTFEIADKEVLTITGLNNNEEFTYDGNSKTPTGTLTVTDDKVSVSELEVLYEGTDNSYSNTTAPVNAGSYKVTYKIADTNVDYTGSVVYNFKINKVQLEKVTLRTDTIVYNGLGSFPAMDNIDFNLQELSGTLGATNVGNYETYVSLKDKNNYEWGDGTTGNLTLNWKIIQATITDASVTLPQATYRVTGSAITPEPTVVVNGRTLVKDTDYTVSYANNTNPGTATVTITGKGNYTGTIQKTFEIVIDISRVTISEISNQTYTGESITTDIIVKDGDNKLIEGTDYEVEYSNNVNVGTATVTITGKGNYVGTINKTFNIVAKNLSTVTTTVDTLNKTYTGKALTTSVTIKDGRKTLKNGTDYTINYSNNKAVGKATVTITGKGNYTGTINKTFNIVAKNLSTVTTTVDTSNKIYTGKALTTSATIKDGTTTLKNGTDYTINYSNNKATGKATVTITGKGNYAGTITKYFYIVPKKVTGVTNKTQDTKSITVKWSKATGATGYEVYKYDTSKKKYVRIKTTTSTSYKVTGLKAGTTYKFKVKAYKIVDGKKYYGADSSVVKLTTKTSTPKILKITAGKRTATIKWGKVSGASGYEIYMSRKKNTGYSKVKNITKGTTVSYTKGSLKKNKTYYVKIRAYKIVDGKKIYSSYSNIKQVQVK